MAEGFVDKDVALLNMLRESDKYQSLQTEISEHLSTAFFRLALSRKNNTGVISIENAREDIIPTMTVGCSTVSNGSGPAEAGPFESYCKKNDQDIYLICGIPPPTLRSAQCEFRLALEQIIELANTAAKISYHIETLSSLQEETDS